MAILQPISNKKHALEDMQHSAEEAAGALKEVCMVLDEISLDMSFARHANRTALRVSSDRLQNVARTLISEAQAGGPVGTKHTSIVGKAALAEATMSVLPFAQDAGQVAVHRFKASHGRAMNNLDWVQRYADDAQSEIRKELRLQITALSGELDCLAAAVDMETAKQLGELEEAMTTRELPASWALEGLDQVFVKVASLEARPDSVVEYQGSLLDSTGSRLETLAEIEFRIAEIFAQLAGDDTS